MSPQVFGTSPFAPADFEASSTMCTRCFETQSSPGCTCTRRSKFLTHSLLFHHSFGETNPVISTNCVHQSFASLHPSAFAVCSVTQPMRPFPVKNRFIPFKHGLRTPNEGKSKISEKLGRCGRQTVLRPYLKIWDWD